MPHRPFRFIHASDLHLDTPMQGLAEVPEALREPLMDAAYVAAGRVFDAAVAEEAEFLVLSGDVLHPQNAGLRGPLFLGQQFERLAARGIAVYWAGGEADPPEAWPLAFPLPANVHAFPRGRPGEFVHEREGIPLARLIGASRDSSRPTRPADFQPDPGGLFSIAAAYGNFQSTELQSRPIHYWALGGRHDRGTPLSSPTVAHYPGTCQARRPEETGPHGCTLVQVDEQGQARTTLLPTDAVRWLSERVAIDETATRESLQTLLRERMHSLIESTPKMDLLVSWTIAGNGPLISQLRRGGLSEEMLGWLRSEYGQVRPGAWGVSLDIEPALALPAPWYEQDTIRGDFLRAVRQLELGEEPLELESFVSDAHLAGILASAAAVPDRALRQRELREAALLGVDLLSGEESP